ESPWERLAALRQRIPNILFQMLLRGANAVGYTNYPDNVVREFVRVAAREGIDVFRIFDSLNYVPAMIPAIQAVREAGAIAEAAVDVVDAAISSMSGLTSQPSLEALVAGLQRQPRDTELSFDALLRHAEYWGAVREYYAPFESDLKSSSGDVYVHEIPGGQY